MRLSRGREIVGSAHSCALDKSGTNTKYRTKGKEKMGMISPTLTTKPRIESQYQGFET